MNNIVFDEKGIFNKHTLQYIHTTHGNKENLINVLQE